MVMINKETSYLVTYL